jgi:hypothetical protein
MDIPLPQITALLLICHTIAISIVQFRHRNDIPAIKPKRKNIVIEGHEDMPVFISQGCHLPKK